MLIVWLPYVHHLSGNENKSKRYDFDLSLPIQRASDRLQADLKAWWNIWRAFWINLSSSRRMNHFVWTSRLAEGLVWVYYTANYCVFNFFVTLYNKLIISKSKFWPETNRNTSSQFGGKAKCAANWPTVKAATVTVVPMTTCIWKVWLVLIHKITTTVYSPFQLHCSALWLCSNTFTLLGVIALTHLFV